ncbi:F-box domain-containing protein [Mycena venus]|uniref:F-box domain-containing protein n=1 Tax=Mycena venus TaxID=2733690 RepID=A0A8H7CP34_9AGAR|nr:F-box domain-containing protein [Mycena venus]
MNYPLPDFHRQRNLDSLSDEVLRRIFGYIQSSADTTHPEILIASVTHHWRELAIKSPSLWTTIRINHDRQISVLSDILLRSQNLPLSIYVRLDAFRYRFFTEYLVAIDILIPHVARWQLLSVTATNPVLHLLSGRIHLLPMPALEHFELVQCDTGQIQHLGPFIFEPSTFHTLRLERTMMYAADASLLAGLTHIELKDSSLAMLDEHKLLSLEYPNLEARAPSMVALRHIVLEGSNPAHDRGPAYSPSFSPAHLTSLSIARLAAPSMDLVQALSRFYGTALSAPALRYLSIKEIQGHALVMLLSVLPRGYTPTSGTPHARGYRLGWDRRSRAKCVRGRCVRACTCAHRRSTDPQPPSYSECMADAEAYRARWGGGVACGGCVVVCVELIVSFTDNNFISLLLLL